PTDPVDPGTDPSNPTDPVDPGTDPSNPTDPVDPGTDPSNPTDPVDPGTDPSNPTDPVDPGTKPEQPTKPNKPETKPSQPTAPVEQPKPVDTNPIENPVTTDKGNIIVAVEDSKPIVQLSDGTTKKVEAKEIGATVQKDGTVIVKSDDGKLKVLPKTGEKETLALSVLGSLMTGLSGFVFFKKRRV
ncbi:MAG: LPXTG cell wall anchor domain-containing protein, partial [Staphylococcus epidermidis]|nr:LPXTG cell wall anchor domain-containing protein [Staphylococcus epidermidis]